MSAAEQRHQRPSPRVALVWRGDADAERAGIASNERLRPIFDAFEAFGATAEPVIYRDEVHQSVADRLAGFDAVLVWVDPIGENGATRRRLDELLIELANQGVWVSAHPDVIALIGTKEVLYRTRDVGWGDDVHLYRTTDELRDQFPARLASGPRVLKPHRGNGGIGVCKIELEDASAPVALESLVSVHEARIRNLDTDTMTLRELLDGWQGSAIDQPFQPRVAEGLIRSYLVADRLVGFAIQGPGDLLNEPHGAERIMGLPAPKAMYPPDHARFASLRQQLETRWLPAMQQRLDIPTAKLPALWDIDFLLGPDTDTYILCEINASCITPFPPEAPAVLVETTLSRLEATRT